MIRVTIELVASSTGKITKLGEMQITNDGFGTQTKGNYDGQVMRKYDFKSVTRKSRVENHPRLSKTVWHLVAKMLDNMGYTK